MIIAPIDVPDALPEIDHSRPVTDPNAFTNGPSRTSTSGAETIEAQRDESRPYYEFQVEQPAAQAPGSASPAYPDILRQAGVEGEALVSFVVDTSGRVDVATFKVVRSTHDLFAAAVRNVLPRMRFIPATVGDRKVRQLVQQPFSFAIVK
jgi:protein TonB